MTAAFILFAALLSHPQVQAATPADPLLGTWIYEHLKHEKTQPGLYPPATITLVLTQRVGDGTLIGHYQAHYKTEKATIPRPPSPDVEFDLVASAEDPHLFNCTSPSGFKGTLAITKVEGNLLRLEWRDTRHPTAAPRFNFGVATLIRLPGA